MLTNKIKKRIERATVTIIKLGGQGVIVPGKYILTAAHCINFSCKGDMAVRAPFFEDIQTSKGKIRATPYLVEPVSDIAVLGCLDGQVHEEAEDYERICGSIEPVPVCTENYEIDKPFDVFIYTHEKKWLRVKAICQDPLWGEWIHAGTITTRHRDVLKGGTSGGPIVNEDGELLGVVSQGVLSGKHAWVCKALPVWIIPEITHNKGSTQLLVCSSNNWIRYYNCMNVIVGRNVNIASNQNIADGSNIKNNSTVP